MAYIEFFPLFYLQGGVAKGQLINLANAVTKHAGYDLKTHKFPTKRMARMIARGEMDLWIGLPNLEEFKDKVLIGDTSLMSIRLNSYRLSHTHQITTIDNFKGKKVILMRGYSYGGMLRYFLDPKNEVTITYADRHEQALSILAHQRAEYLLEYELPILKALNIIEKTANFNFHVDNIGEYGAHFVVSKKTANASIVLQDLEEAYHQLKQSNQWIKSQ